MPYYKDLIEGVFSNHASNWYSYESADRCEDRIPDLDGLTIRPSYDIDAGSAIPMVLKQGQSVDERLRDSITASVHWSRGKAESLGWNRAAMERALDDDSRNAGIPDNIKGLDARLMYRAIASVLSAADPTDFKNRLYLYHFARREGIQEYMRGTQDRALQAETPDYSHLLSLHEFLADELHDTLREMGQEALKDEGFRAALSQLTVQLGEKVERDRIDRILERNNIQRLGMTRELRAKLNKLADANPEAVDNIIKRERTKVATLVRELGGPALDVNTIDLNVVTPEWLRSQIRIARRSATPPEESIHMVVDTLFENTIRGDLHGLRTEIAKYVPASGIERKPVPLEAIITKNKASAHARATAGVCVSGDNPSKYDSPTKAPCLWNLPEYSQVVILDKARRRCEGLILLHSYEEGGTRSSLPLSTQRAPFFIEPMASSSLSHC